MARVYLSSQLHVVPTLLVAVKLWIIHVEFSGLHEFIVNLLGMNQPQPTALIFKNANLLRKNAQACIYYSQGPRIAFCGSPSIMARVHRHAVSLYSPQAYGIAPLYNSVASVLSTLNNLARNF